MLTTMPRHATTFFIFVPCCGFAPLKFKDWNLSFSHTFKLKNEKFFSTKWSPLMIPQTNPEPENKARTLEFKRECTDHWAKSLPQINKCYECYLLQISKKVQGFKYWRSWCNYTSYIVIWRINKLPLPPHLYSGAKHLFCLHLEGGTSQQPSGVD